jgi:hypothetical protein
LRERSIQYNSISPAGSVATPPALTTFWLAPASRRLSTALKVGDKVYRAWVDYGKKPVVKELTVKQVGERRIRLDGYADYDYGTDHMPTEQFDHTPADAIASCVKRKSDEIEACKRKIANLENEIKLMLALTNS